MAFMTPAIFIVLTSFLFCCGSISQTFTKEDIKFGKQYKLLRKSSIKSIKTKFGGIIYDCVDFYKQPAFNLPCLKNHSFHPKMRPEISYGKIRAASYSVQNATNFYGLRLENEGCPIGTVPIKRLSTDDLVQTKRLTETYASRIKSKNSVQPQSGNYFALVQTKSDQSTVKYYGVNGVFNIYDLPMTTSQYSSGEMIIQNGDDMIQVGWTVNPTLNRDGHIHLFQYLNAGQSHCFNMLCPGFVSVSKDMPIDVELQGSSIRGGYQHSITLTVHRDDTSGHWWLEVEGQIIGFWPHQIFKELGTAATYIAVGGEAYSPPDQPLPPMGNGYYPVQNPAQSTYCHSFTVMDTVDQWIDPEDTEIYVNDDHYGVYDGGIEHVLGRTIYYGGTKLWA